MVPTVGYTKEESETWTPVKKRLNELHKLHACDEYNESVSEMSKYSEFSSNRIPQLEEVNQYIKDKSGFRFIPVAGYLTARDFLSLLAFKIFPCTQYIRHHSDPFYTPEPDVVHEMIGHAPVFGNKEFGEFSQQIGLASLGVSDKDIQKLANCYVYTVEFGLTQKKNGEKKTYGAGILSSANEIVNFVSPDTEYRYFRPSDACDIEFPITTLQPRYWWNHSIIEAKELLMDFAKSLRREFDFEFDSDNNELIIKVIN